MIHKRHEKNLLKKKNVVGVGLGKKIIGGLKTDKDCVTVLVTDKQPISALAERDIIPTIIDGVETDVISSGIIRSLTKKASLDPKIKLRPALGGSSIGHYAISAGTFGCVVYRDEQPYILSNNHVLANSNKAQKGDAILQPGAYDGGTPDDKIAELEDFIEIKYMDLIPDCPIAQLALILLNLTTRIIKPSYTWKLTKESVEMNLVDAAIAKPLQDGLVKEEIMQIGIIKGINRPILGMQLQKVGRTSGYTNGQIEVMDATVRVSYGVTESALFEHQIIAGPMSQPGDSGSAVLDMENNLVGLLFAGSDQVTIMNPIELVFDKLKISLKR